MDNNRIEKKFPSYFNKFELPKWAKEQKIEVFRACRTGKVDRLSFLNSYEENEFRILSEIDDKRFLASEYSLSTYMKFRDVKRFLTLTSSFKKPYVIAKGITHPDHGVCLKTREWKKIYNIKTKTSHVDWWLYENARPWEEFMEVDLNEYQ